MSCGLPKTFDGWASPTSYEQHGEATFVVAPVNGVAEVTVSGSAAVDYTYSPVYPFYGSRVCSWIAGADISGKTVGLFGSVEPTFQQEYQFNAPTLRVPVLNPNVEDRILVTGFDTSLITMLGLSSDPTNVYLSIGRSAIGHWGTYYHDDAWSCSGGGTIGTTGDLRPFQATVSLGTLDGMRRSHAIQTFVLSSTILDLPYIIPGSRTGKLTIYAHAPAELEGTSTHEDYFQPWADAYSAGGQIKCLLAHTGNTGNLSWAVGQTFSTTWTQSFTIGFSEEISIGADLPFGLKGALAFGVKQDYGHSIGESSGVTSSSSYTVQAGPATDDNEVWKMQYAIVGPQDVQSYSYFGADGYGGIFQEEINRADQGGIVVQPVIEGHL